MKNQKTSHELDRLKEQSVKKSQKHDANLQKNSTLYFQVGLILCLLGAFGLLEMKFESINIPFDPQAQLPPDDIAEADIPIFVVEKPKVKSQPIAMAKKTPLVDEFEVVDDNELLKELLKEEELDTSDDSTQDLDTSERDSDELDVIEKPDDITVPFVFIEEVPVYPGCENKKSNKDKKKCMSDKINKLVRKKFDGSIASDHGLSGRQKINVEFLIDKQGQVTGIQTRAQHPALEKEAKRVINKIPEMKPGRQRDTPVNVKYSLPIIFTVQ